MALCKEKYSLILKKCVAEYSLAKKSIYPGL